MWLLFRMRLSKDAPNVVLDSHAHGRCLALVMMGDIFMPENCVATSASSRFIV
jgi:hypothetical protein